MTSFLRYGILLALLPAAAVAQTTSHLYVGASAVLRRTAPFDSYGFSHVGPAATIGVKFNERWAVETGFQAVWYANSRTDYAISSTQQSFFSDQRSTTFLVPILARFTVTSAGSPLRVDLLGGVNWSHERYTTTSGFIVNGITEQGSNSGGGHSASVAFGPQVRYALSTRLEAKLNAPLNMYLNRGDSSFGNRLFANPQLGVQYTFH